MCLTWGLCNFHDVHEYKAKVNNKTNQFSCHIDRYCVVIVLLLGVPWTEDEHRLFLMGLQKLGKGDWRGISKSFVMSRTPTQVASHAQKYFLRRSNLNKRKRRSSLFDIMSDHLPHAMTVIYCYLCTKKFKHVSFFRWVVVVCSSPKKFILRCVNM